MDLDCQTCTDQQQVVRGCIEETGQLYVNGEVYKRCPLKIVPHYIYDYIKAYKMYKDGYLPNGKAWLDESNKFIESLSIIEKEINEIERDKMEMLKKHGKR